jgi:hypothetical protein
MFGDESIYFPPADHCYQPLSLKVYQDKCCRVRPTVLEGNQPLLYAVDTLLETLPPPNRYSNPEALALLFL